MNRFGETLRKIRNEKNMSQDEFAALLGTTKQVISRYENGQRSPKVSIVADYADRLGVSIGFLTGDDSRPEPSPLPGGLRPPSDLCYQRVPLIGRVAAGVPILAERDYETYVDSAVDCDAALEIQGDSMEPIYMDGDIVYIKHTPNVNDGQIAVVLLDDTATLKYVYHDNDGLSLLSENRKYPPIRATGSEYEYMAIYGVPVGYTRIYKMDPMKKLKKGMK